MSKSKIKFDKVTDNSVKISWDSPKQEEKAQPIKKYVVERCIADNYEVWEKVCFNFFTLIIDIFIDTIFCFGKRWFYLNN